MTVPEIPPWLILICVNILLLALGCVMDVIAIILVTGPILFPIVTSLGYDLIWFGIIMTINMEMALITPPVGMNLYVIKGVAKDIPIADIIRGALPFVIIEAVVIALCMLFPSIVMWLPGKMF